MTTKDVEEKVLTPKQDVTLTVVDGAEEKPKKTRKRTAKKTDGKVVEFPTQEKKDADESKVSEVGMNTQAVTLLQLKAYLEEGHTQEEIKQYFVDNKLVKDYIPYEELVAAAHFAVDNSCFNDKGEFIRDMITEQVFEDVIAFHVSTTIDLAGLNYQETFDLIHRYKLDEIIMDLDDDQYWNVADYTRKYLFDIEKNNYSAGALVKQLTSILNDISKATTTIAENPELATKLIEEAQNNRG